MKGLQKVFDGLAKIERLVLVGLFIAMVLTVVVQVISRYIMNAPLLWTEEVSRFIFVWMIMIGAGYCLHTGTHIRMDMFANMLPRPAQKVLEIIVDLAAMGLAIAMIGPSVEYSIQQKDILASASGIPYIAVYSAVVVACILLIIHLVEDIIKVVTGQKDKDKAAKGEQQA